MKVVLTGASGLVGRFFVAEARRQGEALTTLGQTPLPRLPHLPFRLGERPDLHGHDVLIHCAFSHVPGRYRGGEGDDPKGFIAANRDGTLKLFEAAQNAGLRQIIFLSSRAVYGDYPAGTTLHEDLPTRPNTLYAEVKSEAETWLNAYSSPSLQTISLRATGVYGPGPGHKWQGLFDNFRAGRTISPRRATEVHGDDLTRAARLLRQTGVSGTFNISDLILDRRDLLAEVARLTGCPHPLPAQDQRPLNIMSCRKLVQLGWRPGGRAKLHATLPHML